VTGNGGEGALADVAARFTEDRFDLESLRTRREEPGGLDEVRDTWAALGGLGWAGMLVPGHHGGSDASWVDLGIVLRALGRALAVTPMVPTGVIATLVLASQADRFADALAGIAAGSKCVAFAHDESAHFGEVAVATSAHPSSDGFALEGAKEHVVLGPVADRWLLSARRTSPEAGDDGVALFLVDPEAPGVVRTDGMLIDGRPVSRARFEGTPVAREAMVTDSRAVLDDALVAGALAEAALMVGGARRALDLTTAYLTTREQFGVPIGAFQALQHRAARLHCEVTLAEALTERALEARDGGDPKAARLAHASKARLSETYLHVAEEGVQMHGGIGMTDETEIGFHLAAARVASMELGDARHHRHRYAELAGY